MDEPSGGTLRFSGHWILTNVFVTQTDILTSVLSIYFFQKYFTLKQNAPLPIYFKNLSHSFGKLLSPDHFWRTNTISVSYYALF